MSAIRNPHAANIGIALRRQLPFILHLAQQRLALREDQSHPALVAFQSGPGPSYCFGLNLEAALRGGTSRAYAVQHRSRHALDALWRYLAAEQSAPVSRIAQRSGGAAENTPAVDFRIPEEQTRVQQNR